MDLLKLRHLLEHACSGRAILGKKALGVPSEAPACLGFGSLALLGFIRRGKSPQYIP